MLKAIDRHRDRIIESTIDPTTRWNPERQPLQAG
jgi:hypothetical protein